MLSPVPDTGDRDKQDQQVVHLNRAYIVEDRCRVLSAHKGDETTEGRGSVSSGRQRTSSAAEIFELRCEGGIRKQICEGRALGTEGTTSTKALG